jgi:hypothetical protein
MSVPRTLYVVVGAIAAPVGVCVGAMAPVAGILAGTIAAALVMLVTTAGVLFAADWRAEVESRQAWAEVALALREWNPIVRKEVGGIETRYPPALADDGLRELFRAHRFLPPRPAAVMELAVAGSAFSVAPAESFPTGKACKGAPDDRGDGENDAGSLVKDNPIDRGTLGWARPTKSEAAVVGRRAAFGVWVAGRSQVRLAVNAGPNWLAPDWALAPPRHTAEVVVLSCCGDARHVRPERAATETADVTGTEPPNCRGPPSLEQRRLTRRVVAKAGHAAPAARASDGDLMVLDDLGHPVPVCAAEVDAIETYLGEVLDELFASSKAGSEPDRA